MEFQDLIKVREEIVRAVVAGIKMKLVADAFGVQLFVEDLGGVLKPKLVLIAAVEIDCKFRHSGTVPLSKYKRTVLVPVLHVDGVAEDCAQQPAKHRPGIHCGIDLVRIVCK